MAIKFILSDYVDRAMSDDKPLCVYAQAIYDKLEDGTFTGRIPVCKGVIAFASTLHRLCASVKMNYAQRWKTGFCLG
ncbi:type II toxin-antitoxin system HicB family antitoxin [Nostoc sp. UHCC 0251]|uniref:type II toxin-antitoxin system HicB family antitoxin n=1 Tax=Nostoc sp. UHCC 0251 TaxID=3110240 RepID=UPI002B214B87|nr:type II toxin-antitoxin system HicB family antitoxin [Nostoc sp. UHCC 0251]MEA5622890.1 type II toxin-antitoxin system HicB family antitoxin [Nostoc sp. UHCC 0251]